MQQTPASPSPQPIDEIAEKILQQFFDAGRAFPIERVAKSLGLARSMADYHVDKLEAAGMLELAAFNPASGTLYFITPKGRACVVERKKT